MTTDKAQKKAVRARMEKTGERYTAARQHIVDAPAETDPAIEPPVVAPLPARVADPGMSDEAVAKATGQGWDHWFALLDAWAARDHNHTEIARYVASDLHIGDWWAQMVTVGYER